MTMKRTRMRRLEMQATNMGTANHGSYINEIMLSLRNPVSQQMDNGTTDEIEAPVQALRLLNALWGSAYALRPEQKLALNDVAIWFERRILQEPAVSTADLLLDLGWLKRLNKYHEKSDSKRATHNDKSQRSGYRQSAGSRRVDKKFGNATERIAEKRREAFRPKRDFSLKKTMNSNTDQAVVAEPILPVLKKEALPAEVEVCFSDTEEVKNIARNMKERKKRKKKPKEKNFTLKVMNWSTGNIEFYCSNLKTQGVEVLFEFLLDQSVCPTPLFMKASQLVLEGEKVFVGAVFPKQ